MEKIGVKMKYVIFDDEKRCSFFPLTFTHSTGDLRVGILKLRQRILAKFSILETNVIIWSDLEKMYRERHSNWSVNELSNGETIFINSRLQIDEVTKNEIKNLQIGEKLQLNDEVLAAKILTKSTKVTSEKLTELFTDLQNIPTKSGKLWRYNWEFISQNAEMIQNDFNKYFYNRKNYFEVSPSTTVLNPYNVWFGSKVELKPGVVLDATNGPIIIDEGARILSNAVIVGPVYIGKKSVIKANSIIDEGTTIGAICKIGGEVEHSIIQGYTNKQHSGFLGHSYLGEWVNLGANTSNSDLKNNYKNVKSYFYPEQKRIDTKNQFVGCVIGDHSKTGINVAINTGTVIGVGCNLFGQLLLKNFVSSFSWGDASNVIKYEKNKFLETAVYVKKRRGLDFSENEKELYSKIHDYIFTKSDKKMEGK
jgi:UDP-N-acetylglucosamine diphosphorylase / glucose-1-phosphate thymidylyltransferase / UDP-N-acetylgalactosamine diphosphorylase / glucosamine-1-phosphate N-acetyltransferase / galactosamine-1-phosphate N-acetyltransferase